MALVAELMPGWDTQAGLTGIILNHPDAQYISDCIIKGDNTAGEATGLSRAESAQLYRACRHRLTAAERLALTLTPAKTVAKADTNNLSAWQRAITYNTLEVTGAGQTALGFLYFYDDDMRRDADVGTLTTLRVMAENHGRLPRITGMPLPPAPPPNPLPADDVDPARVAFTVCELISEIYYNASVAMRSNAQAGPARTSALAAELLSITTPTNGDSHGLRRRLGDMIKVTAPHICAFVGQDAHTNSEIVNAVCRLATLRLPAAQRASTTLLTVEGLVSLNIAMQVDRAWATFQEVAALALADKLQALAERVHSHSNGIAPPNNSVSNANLNASQQHGGSEAQEPGGVLLSLDHVGHLVPRAASLPFLTLPAAHARPPK